MRAEKRRRSRIKHTVLSLLALFCVLVVLLLVIISRIEITGYAPEEQPQTEIKTEAQVTEKSAETEKTVNEKVGESDPPQATANVQPSSTPDAKNGDVTVTAAPVTAATPTPKAMSAQEFADKLNEFLKESALDGIMRAEVNKDGNVEFIDDSTADAGISYTEYAAAIGAKTDEEAAKLLDESIQDELIVCGEILDGFLQETGFHGHIILILEFTQGYKLTVIEIDA